MFTPNPAVNVGATGKPLPMTGTWGVQMKFPDGPPKACVVARIPCLKVIYRVPEENTVCDWTLGMITAVEPQPDGTIKHAIHEVLLDENEAAALYTLKKDWVRGEARPKPVVYQAAEYPEIAHNAHIGGVVGVRITVGPDGLVKNVEATSGPAVLQSTVVAAVKQWKYDPLAIGQRPTSFRVEASFSFKISGPNIAAGMNPSGKIMVPEDDPHYAHGLRQNGVATGGWDSCSAVGCTAAAPLTPH
jgi:TonB family protein